MFSPARCPESPMENLSHMISVIFFLRVATGISCFAHESSFSLCLLLFARVATFPDHTPVLQMVSSPSRQESWQPNPIACTTCSVFKFQTVERKLVEEHNGWKVLSADPGLRIFETCRTPVLLQTVL